MNPAIRFWLVWSPGRPDFSNTFPTYEDAKFAAEASAANCRNRTFFVLEMVGSAHIEKSEHLRWVRPDARFAAFNLL